MDFTLLTLVFSASTHSAFSAEPLQLIESDDTRVAREGNWMLQATPSASGGSYLYSSGSVGDALTVLFAGPRVAVVYVAHPALGTLALEIDNVVVRTVITTSEETVFGMRAVVDYLQPGTHTLRVFAVTGTIALDAFEAVPVALPLAPLASGSTQTAQFTAPELHQIVYLCNHFSGKVCTRSTEPGAPSLPLPSDFFSASPVWSPAGNHLLYSHGHTLNLLRQNGDTWESSPSVAWPLDLAQLLGVYGPQELDWLGNQVIFSAEDASGVRSIYCLKIANLDNATLEICDHAGAYALFAGQSGYSPGWHPDGEQIVYVREGNIYTYTLGESGYGQAVTSAGAGEYYAHPAWSPDGTQIAVAHYTEGADPFDILDDAAVIRLVGSGQALTAHPTTGYFDDNPAWSPDGEQLVFDRVVWDEQCNDGGSCGPQMIEFPSLYLVNSTDTGVLGTFLSTGLEPDWAERRCPDGSYYIRLVDSLTEKPVWATEAYVNLDDLAAAPTNPKVYIAPIADDTGLYAYEAPIINAAPLEKAVAWGSQHCVYARLKQETNYLITRYGSPQEVTYREVWYRLSDESDPAEAAWILAGMQVDMRPPGSSIATEYKAYLYVADWVDEPLSDDPVQDQAAGDPAFENPPAHIPFRYDRQRAANYARFTSMYNFEHTDELIFVTSSNAERYRQVVWGDPLFRGYQRVTGQISPNGMAETGSGVYVSQVLWHGGLPMINTTNSVCLEYNAENQYGWRFCPETSTTDLTIAPPGGIAVGASSQKWTHHESIVKQLGQFHNHQLSDINGYLNNPDYTIAQNASGLNRYWSYSNDTFQTELTGGNADWNNRIPMAQQLYYSLAGINDLNIQPADIPTVGTLFTEFRMGDYMYVDSGFPHGFIIVGWGPPKRCEEIFTDIDTDPTKYVFDFLLSEPQPPDLNHLRIPAQNDFDSFRQYYEALYFIPYIADFVMGPDLTAGVEQRWTQYPGPRPFYCANHKQQYDPTGKTWRGWFKGMTAFKFFQVPDFAINMPTTRLYPPYFDCYNDQLCKEITP